jgi:hypothetical protein
MPLASNTQAFARGRQDGCRAVRTAYDVINSSSSTPMLGPSLGTERGVPPSDEVSAAICPSWTDELEYVAPSTSG